MKSEYKIQLLETGETIALKYNEQYKMWVQIEFIEVNGDMSISMIEILSKQFVQNF